MKAERVTFDPISEDASLQPLDVVGTNPSWGIYLLAHDYPAPKPEVQHASSIDSEGDPVVSSKYGNRNITVRLRLFEPDDPASTNLATNPLAAFDVTSWEGTELSAGPVQVEEAENMPRIGTDSAVEAATKASAAFLFHKAINVTSGVTYRASVYVQLRALSATGVRIAVYNSGATKKAEGETISAVDATADGWVRLDVSFKADSTAGWKVGVEQVGAGAATVRVTGLLVEASEDLTAFFCGDTPGCDWSGTRHESTATRPAPDGTRFSRIYRDALQRIDRIKRTKRGTLRRIAPGFSPITYDLRVAEVTEAPQDLGIGMKRAEVALGFEALPGGRGPEVQVGGNYDEKELPALRFLAEGIPGDMEALGRFQIEDLEGVAQLAAWWGQRQQHYSSSADAALFYQAEGRTPLGTAETAELKGASGAGKNTIRHTSLVPAYQGILSTQASGGGNELAHAGSYQVLARLYRPAANTGEVSVFLSWAEGDLTHFENNDAVTFGVDQAEQVFTITDLGIVTIDEPADGSTPQWAGQINAKSTVTGDDIYIDWLLLIPIDEGSGKAEASLEIPSPTALTVFDGFEQSGGAMVGKTAGLGGVWAGAGDADDFTIESVYNHARRTAKADVSGTGRYEYLPPEYTDVVVRVTAESSNPKPSGETLGTFFGCLARYVDSTHWFSFGLNAWNASGGANWWRAVAYRNNGSKLIQYGSGSILKIPYGEPFSVDLELVILSTGEWRVSLNGETLWTGYEELLKTGGALAKGKVGLWDENLGSDEQDRNFAFLEAWAPSVDQAIFPNQILEIGSSQVRRSGPTGVGWAKPPYSGDFLLVPPAGPEGRTTEFVAKASRNPNADSGIDDLRGRLYIEPRYLQAPPTS